MIRFYLWVLCFPTRYFYVHVPSRKQVDVVFFMMYIISYIYMYIIASGFSDAIRT